MHGQGSKESKVYRANKDLKDHRAHRDPRVKLVLRDQPEKKGSLEKMDSPAQTVKTERCCAENAVQQQARRPRQ